MPKDKLCIAAQDLITAIDGSVPIRESGFKVLLDFAANMTDRHMAEYFGKRTLKTGIVLFGNGHVQADGTITHAASRNVLSAGDVFSYKRPTIDQRYGRGS